MKRFFALCVCALVSGAAFAHAQSPFDGNVELKTGMFYGGMNEYVYEKGGDRELSRLEWEEHFVPYLDLRGEFNFWNFFAAVSLITCIPVKSGIMRNYDYMLPDRTVLSHYSQFDALFDKHLEIYPEIGGGIDAGRWYFGASAGFLYRNRKWTAANGFTQFPPRGEPWSPSLPKEEMAGTIITYEETLWTFPLSLYIDLTVSDQFMLGLVGNVYPYMSVTTVDTHILRNTQFQDKMRGGWGCLAEINLTYRPRTSNSVAFSFGIGYEGIFSARGTTETSGLGHGSTPNISQKTESRMTGNLFWAHLGVIVFPHKLFSDRKDTEQQSIAQ